MYDKYFGSYLLDKGVLTSSALSEILNEQQNIRVKLGMLAMKQGLMTGSQVEEVTRLQRTMDKKFGEIAVGKGYLTADQVNTLLQRQSDGATLKLGQAIVDRGYLDYAQMEKELVLFERDSGLSSVQIAALSDGDPNVIVRELLNFGPTEQAGVYCEYVALLLRNIVRFLDEQPWLEPTPSGFMSDADVTALQLMDGPRGRMQSALYMSEQCYYKLASAFAKMDVTGDREMADATVGEFLNLQNGIFAVNMSEKDIKYELNPPEIISGENDLSGYPVEINVSFGRIGLLLGGATNN
jgi:hypothetical protein